MRCRIRPREVVTAWYSESLNTVSCQEPLQKVIGMAKASSKQSKKGFEIPNSTIALLLVLTIVFMVWSFAVITTSISSQGAAPVTGHEGPSGARIGFRIGSAPVVNHPVQESTAKLTIVQVPKGEAAQ